MMGPRRGGEENYGNLKGTSILSASTRNTLQKQQRPRLATALRYIYRLILSSKGKESVKASISEFN